jgi:CDP-paratose 2-epimerase
LLELLAYIRKRRGNTLPYALSDWRPGDQKAFISDIRRAGSELGWTPKIRCLLGLEMLYDWIVLNREMFLQPCEVSGPALNASI